jgi:hypothetical protein
MMDLSAPERQMALNEVSSAITYILVKCIKTFRHKWPSTVREIELSG